VPRFTSPGGIQSEQVFLSEIEAINVRRAALGRAPLSADIGSGDDAKVIDAVGLALSGGGVRSAAFSLGVLQALNHHNVLRNVDYLSTVSGGGYIGSALTATMTHGNGAFVFGKAAPGREAGAAPEIADTEAVGHLRNYSNYLIPAGGRDILTGSAIALRGLVANLAWVLPLVLLFAALTIATNRFRSELGCADLLGYPLCQYIPIQNFGITITIALAGIVVFFAWALYRSRLAADRTAEFRTTLPAVAVGYLIVTAVMFVTELQTFLLRGMFELADARTAGVASGVEDPAAVLGGSFDWLTRQLQGLAAITVPIAAVVMIFRQQIGDILKAASPNAKWSTRVLAVLSKVALWIAGAAVPLLIWVLYLYLSFWGIVNNQKDGYDADPKPPDAASVQVTQPDPVEQPSNDPDKLKTDECDPPPKNLGPDYVAQTAHTPAWMMSSATVISRHFFCPVFRPLAEAETAARNDSGRTGPDVKRPINWILERIINRPLMAAYGFVGLVLIVLALFLKPNANSLHRLYRDRLSKAFLFKPREEKTYEPQRNEASIDQGRDFEQLDDMPLSTISAALAPYHLINAALNIQGSDYANRRGRNADFFVFSPRHVGSVATGYARTQDCEAQVKDLNLATAMAISGAAASSNMGSASVSPLRPTLALLNIRLGYWMKNPRYIANDEGRKISAWPRAFMWSEITGRLYENSNHVYLTDGGHVENLGVYELLKRQCRLIVVVDAEADVALRFPSFITLQRYARIDLGARIDMPWDDIRRATCDWMDWHAGGDTPLTPQAGPHAAIGRIDYGQGRTGHILYIKSSLTGDENDYVRDYARRNGRFPHESTGDQFFSEEQFEVYRALGFHIAHRLLNGGDVAQVYDAEARCAHLNIRAQHPNVDPVRRALFAE
jgi:predicted acylesterase/phospholipase RssA